MTVNVPTPPTGGGFPGGLAGDRLIRGTLARWDAAKGWTDRDGLPLPEALLVIGYTTALQRWQNNRPEIKTEHPLPDPEELNRAIPITEWQLGLDGKPRPPWTTVYVVYMVDLKTGAVFTYLNSTFGAMMAYSNLEEQIAVMRMLRGEHVFPIVRLEKRPWKSQKFGTQTRPHFQVLDWRIPGGFGQPVPAPTPTPQLGGPSTPTAPPPTTPPATPPSSAPPAPPPPAAAAAATTTPTSTILDHTQPMKPVTVGELIADEIPWK